MKALNYPSYQRIKTLTKYYILTSMHNKSRLFIIILWPIIDLFIWGFTTLYLIRPESQSSFFLSLTLGSFILWNLTIKAQQEISCQLMEDVFSQNFNNLLITPLKKGEILISLIISSIVKLFLVFSFLLFFASLFYSFNILKFSFWLLPFFANLLIFGWSLGIVASGFILRFGLKMDFITWTLAFMIQPFSCVFYSRSILPYSFKIVSWLLPTSYIFEGMRKIILEQNLSLFHLYLSFSLNILYLICACLFFVFMFNWAKKSGNLAKI